MREDERNKRRKGDPVFTSITTGKELWASLLGVAGKDRISTGGGREQPLTDHTASAEAFVSFLGKPRTKEGKGSPGWE